MQTVDYCGAQSVSLSATEFAEYVQKIRPIPIQGCAKDDRSANTREVRTLRGSDRPVPVHKLQSYIAELGFQSPSAVGGAREASECENVCVGIACGC